MKIIKEANVKNYFELQNKIVCDYEHTILLYEAALHVDKEGKTALELLKNNPAFFPFQLPVLTNDFISQHSNIVIPSTWFVMDWTMSF